MNDHPGVFEQRIQAASVEGNRAFAQFERAFDQQKAEQEDLNDAVNRPDLPRPARRLERQNRA